MISKLACKCLVTVSQRKSSAAYRWCITGTFSLDYSVIHGEGKKTPYKESPRLHMI